jgi:anti-sigma factor RsiW
MTCDEIRPLLPAYIDDELDIATVLHVERHLPGCADCRREIDAARAIRQAVSQPAVYFPASDQMRERIRAAIHAGRRENSPRRWIGPAIISGIAAVLLIGIALLFSPRQNSSAEVDAVIASHVRSLQANHLLDVESTDQHTVKPWFAGKVGFSPPVIDLSAEGFPLAGGRLDYLDQNPVAALVYRRNKHVITVFVSPAKPGSGTESKDGYNLIRFQCNGLSCRAVSDLNLSELREFVELFETQHPATTRS